MMLSTATSDLIYRMHAMVSLQATLQRLRVAAKCPEPVRSERLEALELRLKATIAELAAMSAKSARGMTRRERHLRIIQSFGSPTDGHMRHHIGMVQARMGFFATLNDAAVEALARECLRSHALAKKTNEENRRLRSGAA